MTNKEDTMTAAQFSLFVATIFTLVAIAQIVRAITRLPRRAISAAIGRRRRECQLVPGARCH
jgi:hypothetical protein